MILERMINLHVFRKVRQFETLFTSYKSSVKQLNRSSSSLVNLKHSTNSCITTNVTSRLLNKNLNTIQSRPSSTQGDHVRLWVFERLVSASFPILLPTAFILENPVIDVLLAVTVVMHTHWGLEAIIVDYARPIVVGTILPKVAFIALNIISALTLAGLLVLIYNGPGLTKAIKNVWAIGKEKEHTTN